MLTRQHATLGLAAALAGALVLGACETEDLSRRLTGPGGDTIAFGAPLGSAAGLPAGTFNASRLVDLWGRATGLLGFFNNQNAFAFPAWVFEGKLRNASNDPRLPALGSTTANWRTFAVMGTASFGGIPNSYDLFANMQGLTPLTPYTIMLVRYGLQVNGQLDAARVLRGLAADAPDELVVLGGSPGGTPTYPCDFTTAGAPTVAANVNPFVLGTVTSSSIGRLTWDCVIFAGGKWDANDNTIAANQAVIPFGGNLFSTFSLPAYNYVVIKEGTGTPQNPVPTGPAVARVQMGIDLDPDGVPIPNSMAPFPTAAVTIPLVTLMELKFTNASALEAGQAYRFWVRNSETDDALALVGDFRRFEPTGVIIQDSALATTAISGGGSLNDLNVFTVTSATMVNADLEPFDEVLVTIDPEDAATPGDVVFLSAKYQPAPGNLSFLTPTGALKFTHGFTFGGSGTAFFFGDELRLALTNLPAPPLGFFYEVWLVNQSDTTKTPLSLGAIQTPFPDYASLRDADLTFEPGQLIASAALVVDQTELGRQWTEFTDVLVTLSPKVRSGVPLQIAMQADIPEPVLTAAAVVMSR